MEKVKWLLYIGAILLVGVPTVMVLATDQTFSSTFSNIVITLAILFIILGKIISINAKKKAFKKYNGDIAIISGLVIAMLIRLF